MVSKQRKYDMHSTFRLLVCALVVLGAVRQSCARTTLKNLCRLKGQEESTIQGMGLVIGLAGTGDSTNFLPTSKALASILERMNNPLGEKGMLELKDAKNVALVMVTATVPATGARQGDLLECTVSAIGSAKSLERGVLLTTPLLGPQRGDQRVYGFAQGPLAFDDPKIKTTGKVTRGCRLEEDFHNAFLKDGRFTLVLRGSHADFQVAFEIAEMINSQRSQFGSAPTSRDRLARAIDAVNIEVTIPEHYYDDPVDFVSQVLSLPIHEPQTASGVVINERAGTIVISADVEISPVAVHVGELAIEAGQPTGGNQFVGIETSTKPTPTLKNLLQALEALKVPAAEKIAIIKEIERAGKLHGTVMIE
jgi:flagellar P-ring protein precursor FlgI